MADNEDMDWQDSPTDSRDQYSSATRGDQSFSAPRGDQSFSAPRGDQSFSAPRGDQSFSAPRGDQSFSPPRGDQSFSAPRGDQSFSAPRGDQSFSAPRGDQHGTPLPPTATNPTGWNHSAHSTPPYHDAVIKKQPQSASALGSIESANEEHYTSDESDEATQENVSRKAKSGSRLPQPAYSKEMNVDDSPAGDVTGPPTPGNSQAAGGEELYRSEEDIQPSAPPDEATVYITVEWPRAELPQKWNSILEKSLQSWFNSHDFGVTKPLCSITFLHVTGCSAEAKIQPSSALEALLQQKAAHLNFRDSKSTSATVHFHQRPTTSMDPPPPTTLLTLHNSIAAAGSPAQEESSGNVPLLQYCFVAQAYRKEIKRIEEENGVEITEEVKVSIKPKTSNPRPKKAFEEFSDLFRKCSADMACHTIPLKDADQRDQIMDTLKKIQYEEAKLVLIASSEECHLFGPRPKIEAVRKAFGVHSSAAEGSGLGFTDIPQKISMDIKDPLLLLSTGLSMDQIHWDLLTVTFGKKINDIQSKFGVDFTADSSQGKVRVSAKPKRNGRQAAPLEIHALRALMHLYQRVATTTMSCFPQNPNQEKTVRDKLKEIRPQHPYVWAGEHYGPWRLVGLPEHLGPAVEDLEVKLGGPVFREEDKEKIGPTGGSRSSVGATTAGATGGGRGETAGGGKGETAGRGRGETAGGGKGVTAGGGRGETAGGGGTGDDKEETCPICMDTFKKKKKLECGHEFCKECIRRSVESLGATCPVCKKVFGKVEGNQPQGTMSCHTWPNSLPGFPGCGTIVINYDIPSGRQTERHENPGKHFSGATRTAYLPNNEEGKAVLQLLRRAFDQKLIFTVGTSRTSGAGDTVTWNDVHHKTSTHGGPQSFGYPDPDYLSRVKDELKAKGIE